MTSRNLKIIFILAVLAVAGWLLYPTFAYSRMTPEQIVAHPEKAEALRSKSINLGLDLQGGIHMVLGIKADKLKQNVLLSSCSRLARQLQDMGIAVIDRRITANGDGVEVDVASAARGRAAEIQKAVQYTDYLADPQYIEDPAKADRIVVRCALKTDAFDREIKEATSRALEIIRNRIDAFGVSEPTIQQAGDDKIVVELPGAADPKRARALIGRTAQLEFHRTRDDAELHKLLGEISAATGGELTKLYSASQIGENQWDISLKPENKERLLEILALPAAQERVPAGERIYIGAVETRQGRTFIPIYLLQAEAAMTGGNLVMARAQFDERNRPIVTFQFNDEGAAEFGKLTRELMQGQKRLAIVLDDLVQSAPSVRSVITSRGEITGSFTQEQARDLAVVLRSGALPAPVTILEDRTVGPSLGKDSIEKGVYAAIIGSIAVVILMILRYKFSGFIADVCMTINLVLLLACMAACGATLTLPGIAGIVLTVGMAVDANILIFERIREELAAGKGPFAALQAGYDRAFVTILDSNLTTLITAGALYEFGTGPIRGFAVTLSIGIVCSMFTAIFISRIIFEQILFSSKASRLSV